MKTSKPANLALPDALTCIVSGNTVSNCFRIRFLVLFPETYVFLFPETYCHFVSGNKWPHFSSSKGQRGKGLEHMGAGEAPGTSGAALPETITHSVSGNNTNKPIRKR